MDAVAFRARATRKGKHRTEVTEATEGGLGWGVERAWVDTVAFRARATRKGKHRTEVTEVTEGGLGWGVESFLVLTCATNFLPLRVLLAAKPRVPLR